MIVSKRIGNNVLSESRNVIIDMNQMQLEEFKQNIRVNATSTHVVDKHTRRMFSYVFTGTCGGITRFKIIMLLLNNPYNAHQISQHLNIEYKSVQHHLRVLEKNNLVSSPGKKYGVQYNVSNLLEYNLHALDGITDKLYIKLNLKKVYI